MKKVTLQEAQVLLFDLQQQDSRPFFSVTFIKRTTGEERTIARAQFGVKKHLKGGPVAYDALEKHLLCVYDHDAKGYRSINLDSVIKFKIDGVEHEVKTCATSAK